MAFNYHMPRAYQRVNHAASLWSSSRYRMLRSSLATLSDLANETDDPDIQAAYKHSITKLEQELRLFETHGIHH